MNYKEKLKDQRWIIRREEILQRDNYTCRRCGCEDEIHGKFLILNVRHKYYMPNTDPWDYPGEALITWCSKCHREETILKILQELNSLFVQRMSLYKANLVATSKRTKAEYNQLSNDIAKLREKLRKIEYGKK